MSPFKENKEGKEEEEINTDCDGWITQTNELDFNNTSGYPYKFVTYDGFIPPEDEFEKIIEVIRKIRNKKNKDYAKKDDPNWNFRLIEILLGDCKIRPTADFGIFVRLTDKMSRMATYYREGKLEISEETVEDIAIDSATYWILWLVNYRERMKREKEETEDGKT